MKKKAKVKNHKWRGTMYCQICGQYKGSASKFCYIEVKINGNKTVKCKKI